MVTKQPVLPDLLASRLAVVFCGTAAGNVSAARRQYYAHPQNKFWRTLHAVGLTPRLLEPSEYACVLQWRIGLTDLAKHDSGLDNQLPRRSLGPEAAANLRARIEKHCPGILAFTSLTAGKRFLGPGTSFGEQKQVIAATRIWVLPSPSPAAHWNWNKNEGEWRALATRIAELSANASR